MITSTEADVLGVEEGHGGGWRTWAMVGGTVLALAALLSQVPSLSALWDTLRTADWWWIVAAMGFAVGNKVGYAVALMGSVQTRLPALRSIEALFAAAFSNLAVPGVGSTAVQVRFLQLQGVDLASAVAAGAVLANIANVVIQGALFLAALAFAAPTLDPSALDLGGAAHLVLVVVFLAGVCVAVAFGIPRFRRHTLLPTRRGLETLRTALRSPRQVRSSRDRRSCRGDHPAAHRGLPARTTRVVRHPRHAQEGLALTLVRAVVGCQRRETRGDVGRFPRAGVLSTLLLRIWIDLSRVTDTGRGLLTGL